jgi:hypothetical protein
MRAVSRYNMIPYPIVKYRVWCRIHDFISKLGPGNPALYLAVVQVASNMVVCADITEHISSVEEQKRTRSEDRPSLRLGAESSEHIAHSAETQQQDKLNESTLRLLVEILKIKFSAKYRKKSDTDKFIRDYNALETLDERHRFIEQIRDEFNGIGDDGKLTYNYNAQSPDKFVITYNGEDITKLKKGGAYRQKLSKKRNIKNKKYSRKHLQKKRTSKKNKNIYY